jgi:bifunctional non-homologous end joining protein LigD
VITHPEKLLFPDDGITKGELADYYEAVAPLMLPHIRGRPVSMERFPSGIGAKGFVQKDVSKGFPDWLQRVEVPKKGGVVHHPLANDVESLRWLANQNCITPHVWISRVPDLNHPDLCVFDLDPSSEDAGQVRAAALIVRDLLAELGLPSWVKTSGSKGFHVIVPLDGKAGFDAAWQFADSVGRVLVGRHPDVLTQEFIKVERDGRIFVDIGRNGYSATFAAAYAVRPKPGAPVSAPCTWDEIESGAVHPQSFNLRNLPERLAAVGDVWADLHKHGRSLHRPLAKLQEILDALLSAPPPHTSFRTFRSRQRGEAHQ